MRILVVEDDVKLARALERGLTLEGYAVETARTGDEGLARASREPYDAVVLDLLLPGLDGLAVCARLRDQERWTPVLMLTALSDVADRVRGLDGGADDYVVKPFDLDELCARLRVLVRRGPVPRSRVVAVGDLRVDSSTRVATVAGHQVELTAREFDVLDALARTPGHLVRRDALLREVWEEGHRGSPNIADVYVGYLRRKLDALGSGTSIRTVRGQGFVLEPA
jgi:two-component system OmpR family response regulator